MKVIGVLIGILGVALLALSVSPAPDLKRESGGFFNSLREGWRLQFEYWRKGLSAPILINPYFYAGGVALASISLIILAAV
jgi:hypothetical protein